MIRKPSWRRRSRAPRLYWRPCKGGQSREKKPLQLYYVFNDRTPFGEDKVDTEKLVLARCEAEARMLVREDHYRTRRQTPGNLKAMFVPLDGAGRILSVFDEGVRLKYAEEEAP